jgi:hypothetical protein
VLGTGWRYSENQEAGNGESRSVPMPRQSHLRKIALVILGNQQWPVVRLYLDRIAAAVKACTPGSFAEVDIPYE